MESLLCVVSVIIYGVFVMYDLFCDNILTFCDVWSLCDNVWTFCDVWSLCDNALTFCDNVWTFCDVWSL